MPFRDPETVPLRRRLPGNASRRRKDGVVSATCRHQDPALCRRQLPGPDTPSGRNRPNDEEANVYFSLQQGHVPRRPRQPDPVKDNGRIQSNHVSQGERFLFHRALVRHRIRKIQFFRNDRNVARCHYLHTLVPHRRRNTVNGRSRSNEVEAEIRHILRQQDLVPPHRKLPDPGTPSGRKRSIDEATELLSLHQGHVPNRRWTLDPFRGNGR